MRKNTLIIACGAVALLTTGAAVAQDRYNQERYNSSGSQYGNSGNQYGSGSNQSGGQYGDRRDDRRDYRQDDRYDRREDRRSDHYDPRRDEYNYGIILFEDRDYRGESRPIRGDEPDLDRLGFNDRVSSLKVMRGDWEACEHAYFRGRCWRFGYNMRVLPNNQNDRISSIRRLRR